MTHRTLIPAFVAVMLGLAACSGDDGDSGIAMIAGEEEDVAPVTGEEDGVVTDEEPGENQVPITRTTELVDAEGSTVGLVTLTDEDLGVLVEVEVTGMTEGFHPVALYETGVCEPESSSPDDPALTGDFLSAGTVLGLGEAVDGPPLGAMPPLFVNERAVGQLASLTGPTDLDELLAGDGTTLIVQEGVPSIADLPILGEGGSRIACASFGE